MLKLWTEASLNSEAKSDPKDIESRTDFSAKKQEQFHRFGNHSMGESVLPCLASKAK